MRKDKNHIDDLIHNFITEDKIKNIANILDALVEILILLEPLLEKIKSMGNANDLNKNIIFGKIIRLFEKISNESRAIGVPSNLSTLLQDLMN